MKSPIPKRVHFIKEVTLPSLTFQSKPHCGQCDIWLGGGGGGELAKEVAFIYVFVTILIKPILYVQWLAVFPFCEAVILYNLLFQFKLHFFFFFFVVLPNLQVGKLKLCLILLMLD